jgi:hypothetical protein
VLTGAGGPHSAIEAFVSGDHRCIQDHRQSQIERVVEAPSGCARNRQRRAQEIAAGVATDRNFFEQIRAVVAFSRADLAPKNVIADHAAEFEIEELRGVQVMFGIAQAQRRLAMRLGGTTT